eukprot:TRINITY_DN63066_c0_g1_i1.p1 TRINITY_DN63066_c0_g1~~TRINITY_DN63066_c0_g1_i1.p1  ORF type:complete len:271 (-),score=42.72 TRINITY_DN63066_c0_g1_i1:77-889(-)
MSTSGSKGILKARTQRPRAVAVNDFPSAQVVLVTPFHQETARQRMGSLLYYTSRVVRAKVVSSETNAQRAEFRAAILELDIYRRGERVVLAEDEDFAAVDAQQERQPSPAPPSDPSKKSEKVVRFADDVDTVQFDFTSTEQCELSSAHELCLTTFLSRVKHAHNFSHEFNASEALDIALGLREELEMQQQEAKEEDNAAFAADFFVDHSFGSGSYDESERHRKRTKKCFWIVDVGCMPQQVDRTSERARWQDQVRQGSRMIPFVHSEGLH